jgi:hypothetical protein
MNQPNRADRADQVDGTININRLRRKPASQRASAASGAAGDPASTALQQDADGGPGRRRGRTMIMSAGLAAVLTLLAYAGFRFL